MIHNFTDSIHPSETTGSRSCFALEAVTPFGQCVQVRLYSHSPKLFPAFYCKLLSRPIGFSVNKQHGSGILIECKFGNDPGVVRVATLGVGSIGPVCKSIRWVDRHSPLHFTGDFMEIIDCPGYFLF